MKEFIGFKKGINLGGWLSQCDADKHHFDSFITKNDIALISKNGFDHIRLPIDHYYLDHYKQNLIGSGVKYIDKCIKWCSEYNLNLLLDLHNTKGYDFNNPDSAYAFFKSDELKQNFINLWECIAIKYGKYNNIAFELLNEIVPYDVADKWNKTACEAAIAIRKYAPTTPIVIGGVSYNHVKSVKLLKKPDTNDIVFTFHCYEPFYFTHQGASWVNEMPADFRCKYSEDYEILKYYSPKSIQELMNKNNITSYSSDFFDLIFEEAINWSEKNDAALYCGEYGVINLADKRSTIRWYNDIRRSFNKYGIGSAAWTYKEKDFGLTDNGLFEKVF